MVVEGYNAMSGYGPWKCPRTTTAAKFSFRPPTAAVFPQDSSTHLHCTHENSSDLGHFILASREPGSQFVHQLEARDPGPSLNIPIPFAKSLKRGFFAVDSIC